MQQKKKNSGFMLPLFILFAATCRRNGKHGQATQYHFNLL